MMSFRLSFALAILAVIGVGLALTFERPPVAATQQGYRGTGMVEVDNPRTTAAKRASVTLPDVQPPQDKAGKTAGEEYKNVQVLKDMDANEFLRLMAAITDWVSPEQGCTYCHAEGDDLAIDKLYTKTVSRRMLQMTLDINAKWKNHVADTGVTCFTCHRGKPVPPVVRFVDPGPRQALGMAGYRAGQNAPSPTVGLTSLPYDPLTAFLDKPSEIRVVSTTALPAGNPATIKQTEWTYGLMFHLSEGLGVNCTFCHNTRSFSAWDQSSPKRETSWHGIRLVRDLNAAYLEPLKQSFPANRLGPHGDVPKVSCATCHQGANKPLLGAQMLKDYPELAGKR